jgi:hypothetical protein
LTMPLLQATRARVHRTIKAVRNGGAWAQVLWRGCVG